MIEEVRALSEFEAALADLQTLHLGIEGRGWDSKLGRSPIGAGDPASAFGQCGLNDLPLTTQIFVRGLRFWLSRGYSAGYSWIAMPHPRKTRHPNSR